MYTAEETREIMGNIHVRCESLFCSKEYEDGNREIHSLMASVNHEINWFFLYILNRVTNIVTKRMLA